MNKNLLLLGLVLGALFFLRNNKSMPAYKLKGGGVSTGLIGVDTEQPGFGGFDVNDPW